VSPRADEDTLGSDVPRTFVTIVTGVPRSGTSLLMQVLAAGGLPPLADDARPPDADNPRGYFEWQPAKRLPAQSGWLAEAQGRAVKVVHALVPALPEGFAYRLILVRRAFAEVLASQERMLARRGETSPPLPPSRLAAIFEAQLAEVAAFARERGAPLLEVSHARLLAEPGGACAEIAAFLGGGLDAAAMVRAVEPALHRQRGGPARPDGV
jgi:LPS sulfotransferase NodH